MSPMSRAEKFSEISSLEDPENEINKFVLKSRDIVNIYSDPRDQMPGNITITGAVHFPGVYPIISNNETIGDIIKRAGGLLQEAYPMGSTFIRSGQTVRLSFTEIIDNLNSKENFIVMNGDWIKVGKSPNIVRIIGEVHNPGIFQYYSNYNLKNYIKIAGGVTINAEHREIWVTYPNGTSKKLKRFLPAPKVYDGSVITIGREEETEPFDVTEYTKEVTTIIANLAQVLLLYAAVR
jgi:protein involved in polysaccharide export with SLBB domain